MKYFVYILECNDKTLYIGFTTDLTRRVEEHNSEKSITKYTRGRRPVVLKYHEEFENKPDALAREWELKHLTKVEKLKLIK